MFNQIGLIPPARPAWPFDPIPPFGVPSVLSKAFWGGVWGAALAPLLSSLRGRAYWAGWIVVGAVALPLVAFFVVPPIKGEPIPELWPRFPVAMMINGFWGFGTALFLRLTGADPRRHPNTQTQSENVADGSNSILSVAFQAAASC